MQGFLKDTFRDHTPEPPRDLWGGIEAELRPRRRLAWLPYASAIAAMVVVVVGLMWILASGDVARQTPGAASQPMAQTSTPPATVADTPGAARPQPLPAQAQETQPAPPSTVAQPQPAQVLVAETRVSPLIVLPISAPVASQRISSPDLHTRSGTPAMIPLATASPSGQATAPAMASHKQEYDFSRLSVDDVLLFAARSLGRVADLPFAVYADNSNPQQVKAYQVQMGEKFSIERKRATP